MDDEAKEIRKEEIRTKLEEENDSDIEKIIELYSGWKEGGVKRVKEILEERQRKE